MQEPAHARAVVDFWFGTMDGEFPAADRSGLWWGASAENDARIGREFGPLHGAAERGELDAWHVDATGSLACILILDQFTRMLYRGTADAFRNDAHALRIAESGMGLRLDRQLPIGQRVFYYMPFMHSEEHAIQRTCVELFEELVRETPAPQRDRVANNLRFAREHLDVIERFGRFPHRNRLLGRDSTSQEEEYLAGGGASWGQG